MSYADKVFINMCSDIIENGTSTEAKKYVRYGKMEQPAYTIKNLEL